MSINPRRRPLLERLGWRRDPPEAIAAKPWPTNGPHLDVWDAVLRQDMGLPHRTGAVT